MQISSSIVRGPVTCSNQRLTPPRLVHETITMALRSRGIHVTDVMLSIQWLTAKGLLTGLLKIRWHKWRDIGIVVYR